MLKRIVAVLREQHVGKVMFAVYVVWAVKALGDALNDPFLNRVVHFFNVRSNAFPHMEPPIVGLQIGFKALEVFIFSVLAALCYRSFCRTGVGRTS